MMSQTVMEKKLMGHYLMTGVSMTTSLLWWSDGEEVDYYLIISWSCDLLALATSLLLPNVACTFFYLHLWNLNWVFSLLSCGLWPCGCLGDAVEWTETLWLCCMHVTVGEWVMEIACCLLETWMLQPQWYLFIKSSIQYIVCMWMMYGCNYYVELNVLSGYMYCYRFELPIPDRNRYVPFPTYRNIDFVFPSAFPVPKKKYKNSNG